MKLSNEDAALIYDWINNNGDTPQILYELFMNDMPYGTAKARDGDPDNWLADHVNWVEDRFHVEMLEEAERRKNER